jgi:2-aminomuconate deaminase
MATESKENLTKPLAHYSHARQAGHLVFIAGQGCRDPETDVWAGVTFDKSGNVTTIDFEAQVRGVFRNIDAVLAVQGLTKHQIIDIQVFLTSMTDQFPIMNKVWNEFFKDVSPLPTRTTIAVKELPGLNLIEMKAIAVAKDKK